MNQEYLTQYKRYLKQELVVTLLIAVSLIVFVPLYYSGNYHTRFTLGLFIGVIFICIISTVLLIRINKNKLNFLRTTITERLGQYSALNFHFISAGGRKNNKPKLDKYFKKCTTDREFMQLLEYFNTEYSTYCYSFDLDVLAANKKDCEFISKFIAYKTYMKNNLEKNLTE